MRAEAKPIANCDHQPPITSYVYDEVDGNVFFVATSDDENLNAKCGGYQAKEGFEQEEKQITIIHPETKEIICLALSCQFNQLDLNTVKEIPYDLVEILFGNQE